MTEVESRVLELARDAAVAACKSADEDGGPPESFTGWRTLHVVACGQRLSVRIEVHAIKRSRAAAATVYGVEVQLRDWGIGLECGVGLPGAAASTDRELEQAVAFCLHECARDLGKNPKWRAIVEAWHLADTTSAAKSSRARRL